MNRNKFQRLNAEEKEKIRELSLSGKSLNEIKRIMNLGKTTIYYQVRKFKPRIKKEFIINLNNFQIGELIGAFAGDGSFFHNKNKQYWSYKIRYHLSTKTDYEYAVYLSDLLKRMNLNPMIFIVKKDNKIDLTINSKEFYEFIKKYLIWEENKTLSIRLKEEISCYSDEFLRGFVRGIMDTDGFVEKYNVSCACISERLMINLINILDKFGLKYKFTKINKELPKKDLFRVRVKFSDLDKYQEMFNFSNEYKIKALIEIIKNGVAGI